jgi:hypothetical protein
MHSLLPFVCAGWTVAVSTFGGIDRESRRAAYPPRHVVIVIEENHSYSEVIGVGTAPTQQPGDG